MPPNPAGGTQRRYLANGSSITQSRGSFHNYVNTAATMLEASVINLGMGGSCWVEPSVAEFIAERDDWDFASFELGINMQNPACENQGFPEKVAYLLERVTAAHPEKPVFLITIFNCGTFQKLSHQTGGLIWRKKMKS